MTSPKTRLLGPGMLLLLLAAQGCDSNRGTGARDAVAPDGGPGGDGREVGAGIELPDLPAQVGHAICEQRFACCSAAERDRAGFAPDAVTCAQRFVNAFNLALPEYERSIDSGRAGYDGAALAGCLAAYRALGCAAARVGVPTAISVAGCPYLIAKVALGGACRQSFECVAGYCAGVGLSNDGVCTPLKPDGADCLSPDQCQHGECDPDAEVCGTRPAWPLCEAAHAV